jgi:hypothetical protein
MLRMTWTRGAVAVAIAVILATGAGVIAGAIPLDTALAVGRAIIMGADPCDV